MSGWGLWGGGHGRGGSWREAGVQGGSQKSKGEGPVSYFRLHLGTSPAFCQPAVHSSADSWLGWRASGFYILARTQAPSLGCQRAKCSCWPFWVTGVGEVPRGVKYQGPGRSCRGLWGLLQSQL